jgi:hypothetical protein
MYAMCSELTSDDDRTMMVHDISDHVYEGCDVLTPVPTDDDEDDELQEIDLDNIVQGGRRTRGKVIDFAKAAEENKDEIDDDDEEDDDDFEAPDEEMEG